MNCIDEKSNHEIAYYEREGSPIIKIYQMWFNTFAERVQIMMAMDIGGVNRKTKRRKRTKKHKSLYAERYYRKIKGV